MEQKPNAKLSSREARSAPNAALQGLCGDRRPPVPAFYIKPASIEALVDHTVGRLLDLLDLDTNLPHRWREAEN
jgi:3-polyprenyl-4-hydroxybenzoate decarboxylase